MPERTTAVGTDARRVFYVLGGTASVLGLGVGLLLTGGGTGVRTGLMVMAWAAAGALIWTPVAWLPAWRRLTAESLPASFRLAVMACVGGLAAVPAFALELLTQGPPAVLWFFVGVFGLLTGLLGAAALSLLNHRQR